METETINESCDRWGRTGRVDRRLGPNSLEPFANIQMKAKQIVISYGLSLWNSICHYVHDLE